ncbi:hypothetical protein B0H14DRAFT_2560455 [Mycena olivaceomarginata]|nr:hypothetical protein B0H14DRAFT_2560455 [Mycena olivaceomarginata]
MNKVRFRKDKYEWNVHGFLDAVANRTAKTSRHRRHNEAFGVKLPQIVCGSDSYDFELPSEIHAKEFENGEHDADVIQEVVRSPDPRTEDDNVKSPQANDDPEGFIAPGQSSSRLALRDLREQEWSFDGREQSEPTTRPPKKRMTRWNIAARHLGCGDGKGSGVKYVVAAGLLTAGMQGNCGGGKGSDVARHYRVKHAVAAVLLMAGIEGGCGDRKG